MKKYGFPKQARIIRERDFQRLRRRGLRLTAYPLRVRALPRDEGDSRLGLAVGRRVGPAVVRNRWKRAIREAFRLNRHRLRQPYDMAVSVAWEAEPGEATQVEQAFLQVVEQLNARADDTADADTAG
ncbi:MAG: ribonuclease P protein component [Candidatus Brocadiia bacterium]